MRLAMMKGDSAVEPPAKRRKVKREFPTVGRGSGPQDAGAAIELETKGSAEVDPATANAEVGSVDGCEVQRRRGSEGERVLDGRVGEPSPTQNAAGEGYGRDLAKDHADPVSGTKKHGEDPCTYEEALSLRYRARELGSEAFLHDAVTTSHITLQKLYSAFNILFPANDTTSPSDSHLLTQLKRAITTDMSRRIKLREHNSIADAIALIQRAKNILVLTGAGISTSLKIPDFRSPDGLYPKLRAMGFSDPENVFSRDSFEQDPRPFFSVAAMVLPPADGKFTPAHSFLRLLQDKGKLLTLYTQNIDGVDVVAGIRRNKLVQLHGSFETATCVTCGLRVSGREVLPAIRKGEVPACGECVKERQVRMERAAALRARNSRSVRLRTTQKVFNGSSNAADPSSGVMRPDIVFMGEPPRPYLARFQRDCARVDLVLVIGTSLPVEPVSSMPNRVPAHVPQICVSKQQMGWPETKKNRSMGDFDIQLLGECDVVAQMLARGCGWDLRHELLAEDARIEVEPVCGMAHCHVIVKERASVKVKDETGVVLSE